MNAINRQRQAEATLRAEVRAALESLPASYGPTTTDRTTRTLAAWLLGRMVTLGLNEYPLIDVASDGDWRRVVAASIDPAIGDGLTLAEQLSRGVTRYLIDRFIQPALDELRGEDMDDVAVLDRRDRARDMNAVLRGHW